MKHCPKCNLAKDESRFRKNAARRDGLSSYCRKCDQEYHLVYQRQYRQDPEHHKIELERKAKFREKHRKELNAKRYQYRKEHPELIKTQEKRYREKHYDSKANTERSREYRQTSSGKMAITRANLKNSHKRRAALQSCKVNDLSNEEIKLLLQKSIRCVICKRLFNNNSNRRKKTVDHIIPISKGGNNTLLNTQVICKSCNSKKRERYYAKFNNGQLLMFLT